jgi:hydrogenase/urease accessory protein HupE
VEPPDILAMGAIVQLTAVTLPSQEQAVAVAVAALAPVLTHNKEALTLALVVAALGY